MPRRFLSAVAFLTVATCAALVAADACDDSFLLTGDSPSSVLSAASINAILTEHNNARRSVSPAAATMPMLTWDQTLADFAQDYMDGCPGLTHSSSSVRSNAARFNYSYVGENLAAGTSASYTVDNGGAQSTRAWNGELSDWTYPTTCTGVCGHYTQVIWANTLTVGCGYKRCPNERFLNFWSCVYGPGGNYNGQAPYVQATATTTTATCQVNAASPALTPMPAIGSHGSSVSSASTTAPVAANQPNGGSSPSGSGAATTATAVSLFGALATTALVYAV